MRRICADILLGVTVVVFPWWVLLSVGVVGSFAFKRWWEVIIAAIIFDLIYSVPRTQFFGFQFITTVVMAVLVGAIIYFKRYLR